MSIDYKIYHEINKNGLWVFADWQTSEIVTRRSFLADIWDTTAVYTDFLDFLESETTSDEMVAPLKGYTEWFYVLDKNAIGLTLREIEKKFNQSVVLYRVFLEIFDHLEKDSRLLLWGS